MGSRRFSRSAAMAAAASLLGVLYGGAARAADTMPPDVPGFGGSSAPPRVLVILDTSRSMRFNPTYSYEDAGLNEDFVASPRTLDANCSTKFCIAKRAVYDVLSATGSLLDGVGISGYYQTNRYINVNAIPDANQLTCTYDVIAKANQDISGGTGSVPGYNYSAYVAWKSRVQLDASSPGANFACNPTSSAGIPGLEAVGGLRSSYLGCTNPTWHTCHRWKSGTWPSYDTLKYPYFNPGCPATTTPPFNSSLSCVPSTTWVNPADSKTYTYQNASTWDGTVLWVNATAKTGGSCPANYYLGVTAGNSCSPTNPCDWYLWSTTGAVGGDKQSNGIAPQQYVYHNVVPATLTIGATTYDYKNGLNATATLWIAANAGDTCPTTRTAYKGAFVAPNNTYACSATPDGYGCDLTLNGGSATALSTTTVAASTMYGYNNTMNVAGYSLVSPNAFRSDVYSYQVSISAACDHSPGEVFTVSTATYQGLTLRGGGAAVGSCSANNTTFGASNMGSCVLVEGAETVNTDTGKRTCTFTQYQYQYFKPAVLQYYCAYTGSRYLWSTAFDQCRYRRKYYTYGLPYWQYFMYTDDGDIADTETKITSGLAQDTCAANTADATLCPDTYTGGKCAASWAKACKLRWTGRYSQTVPTSYVARPFCQEAGTPSADRYSFKGDWCSSVRTTAGYPADRIGPYLIADYYDPSTSNPTSEMQVGMPTTPVPRTGTYSFDPPLHATKDLGLSFYHAGANAGAFGVNFIPISPGNSSDPATGDPFRALQKYDPSANPLGLRMPSDGNYTPLYGALVSAKAYLTALANGTAPQTPAVAADPATACRGYYVILVTDGNEEQPNPHTADQLGQAVADLRNILGPDSHNVDAQTFVIGFGIVSDALDHMAVAGGHPVDSSGMPDPSCMRAHCTAGHAYNAADSATLTMQLRSILAQITSGAYTRAKPVLVKDTSNGWHFYSGYFDHSGRTLVSGDLESAEWKGHLDHYDLNPDCTHDTTGAVPADPTWQFDRKLDAAAGTGFRQVYTHLTGETQLRTFDDEAHDPDGSGIFCNLTEQIMGTATCTAAEKTAADTVIQFVRNDRGARASFAWGGTKSSRLSDIYHSGPAVLGPPSFNDAWTEGTAEQIAYNAFKTRWTNRPRTVFVGSNTGMLHAVHEDWSSCGGDTAGTERWAFVPHAVLPLLPTTRNQHAFTVDGGFAISDVCFGASNCGRNDGTGWKTILIGTLGWGGAGIYALDITDVTAPQFLWEAEGLPGFGQTRGPPVIARVRVNTASNFKWGAFIGGGVSAVDGQGDTFQVLDVETGQVLVGADGVLDRASWSVATVNRVGHKNNVASRPRVVFPYDQSLASVVYFSDTDAKLSRMPLASVQIRDWAPQTLFNPFADPSSNGCPATDLGHLSDETSVAAVALPLAAPTGLTPWPVMASRPVLGVDDAAQGTGDRILFIGTGDPDDPRNINSQEYILAVRDDTDLLPVPPCKAPLLWGKRLAPGDKVLSDPALYRDWIVFAVYKPPLIDASCAASGGTTLYCFNKLTGAPSQCLAVPNSTSGEMTDHLDLGNVGILSDLFVTDQGQLIYTTSSLPDRLQSNRVQANAKPIRVRSWRRIQ